MAEDLQFIAMLPRIILANTSKSTIFNYILAADIALIGVFLRSQLLP